MPEDVRQALERFQRFAERFPAGSIIDEESGFGVADAMLLAGGSRCDPANPMAKKKVRSTDPLAT